MYECVKKKEGVDMERKYKILYGGRLVSVCHVLPESTFDFT